MRQTLAVYRAMKSFFLDAAPLGHPATVVGDGGDVANEGDLETGRGDRAQRRLAARARTLDHDLNVLEAVLHGLRRRVARRDLRRERGRLARALEPARAGRRPRDHVSADVTDGDHRVVERRLDVNDPVED